MTEDDQANDSLLPADKPEPEYLGMPLILCKTSRPRSLSRKTRLTAEVALYLMKNALVVLGLRKADE